MEKLQTGPLPDFNSLAGALNRDMERICCVDAATGAYTLCAPGGSPRKAGGEDFFEACRQAVPRLVYADDRERVAAALQPEALRAALGSRPAFYLDFRLLADGRPQYYRLKALYTEHGRHILLGVSNVNEQITEEQRQEAEQVRALRLARELANRDALTGVKSKRAFDEAEALWNERVAAGEAPAFAIVFCDLNGLKEVNDQQGHKAGDQYLKTAATVVCNMFKHSPVYRIGGDEFVAVLGGSDYQRRRELVESLREGSRLRRYPEGVVVACGLGESAPGLSFTRVFELADASMYENKAELKQLGLAAR